MIGAAGFMAAPKGESDEVNKILADMEKVWEEETRRIAASTPRCHFTPMEHHMGEDESWWECRHCGHTKEM